MSNRIKPSSRRPKSEHPNKYACGKVLKHKNGKASTYHTMSGIAKRDRVALPELRIGREWYFRFDHGYIDLYFINGAVRVKAIESVKVRLGRIVNGRWERTTELAYEDWLAIAARMWPKSQADNVQRVYDSLGRAILKHYETRYPTALPQILAINHV